VALATGGALPLYTVVPFVVMLLAIAVFPLWLPRWWEPNRNKLAVSAVLGLPVLALYAVRRPGALLVAAEEYVSFIVLLAGLFVIAGGIALRGDLEATPLTNTAFLAIGSALASFIGTTGASMLLIRPLLRTNRQRSHVRHTIVFFIFLVSNVGGMLTPLGDPPLFRGIGGSTPASRSRLCNAIAPGSSRCAFAARSISYGSDSSSSRSRSCMPPGARRRSWSSRRSLCGERLARCAVTTALPPIPCSRCRRCSPESSSR
jgi:putative citrate transport